MKLNGLNKINTAVFISGRGSNLKSLIKFSLKKNAPINIKLIISDKHKSPGLSYAQSFNIKKKIFKFEKKINQMIKFYLI